MGNFEQKVNKFIEIFLEEGGYVKVAEGLENTLMIAVAGLLIGIVISLISSLLITRLVLKCFLAFTENPKAYALRKKAKELPEDLVAVTSNEGGKE